MTQEERTANDIAKALMLLDKKSELESLEHVDSGDFAEALEHLSRVNPKAANVLAKAVKTGNALPARPGDTRKGKKASVTVQIKRTITKGNTILTDGTGNPVNLPAPLFGVLEYESNYSRVLAAFLPKDGSVKVKSFAKTADGQSLLITFQSADDAVNETVLITGTNTIWTNLLRGMSSSLFEIVKPKIILGDVARINQFDQPVNIFDGSMFTAAKTDNISPQDYKTDYLSDNTVRILGDEVPVNPEKTIVPMIVPSTIVNANGASFYYSVVMPLSNIRKDQ